MYEIYYKKIEIFRVTVLGSAGIGKSAIINRLVNNSFSAIYEPTYEITYIINSFQEIILCCLI